MDYLSFGAHLPIYTTLQKAESFTKIKNTLTKVSGAIDTSQQNSRCLVSLAKNLLEQSYSVCEETLHSDEVEIDLNPCQLKYTTSIR